MKKLFDAAIAGEINFDLILYGLPEELPLERELLASDFRLALGSSSEIVAHNLAVLGVSVGFLTRLGDNEFGNRAAALSTLRPGGTESFRDPSLVRGLLTQLG